MNLSRHHLAGALSDQVLEIARLENADDVVEDILCQALLDPALERGRQRIREPDRSLGGGKDLLRRLIGAAHHGVELMRDAGDVHCLLVEPWARSTRR
jgi:hypothetical protein